MGLIIKILIQRKYKKIININVFMPRIYNFMDFIAEKLHLIKNNKQACFLLIQ